MFFFCFFKPDKMKTTKRSRSKKGQPTEPAINKKGKISKISSIDQQEENIQNQMIEKGKDAVEKLFNAKTIVINDDAVQNQFSDNKSALIKSEALSYDEAHCNESDDTEDENWDKTNRLLDNEGQPLVNLPVQFKSPAPISVIPTIRLLPRISRRNFAPSTVNDASNVVVGGLTLSTQTGNNLRSKNVNNENLGIGGSIMALQSAISDLTDGAQKLETVQRSLELANKELSEKQHEKDVAIEALKKGGEKLSMQSNIIEKLRSKEEESDSLIRKQNEQIEELKSELERALSAKNETEHTTQTETIKTLKTEKLNLLIKLTTAKSDLDSKAHKLKIIERSYEAAKKESAELPQKNLKIQELKNKIKKLSTQNQQQSNTVKSLEAKEKEADLLLKKQNEQIEELKRELEWSKKSLSAKDEMERTRTEAFLKSTLPQGKLLIELACTKIDLEATKKGLNEKLQEKEVTIEKLKNECETLSKRIGSF